MARGWSKLRIALVTFVTLLALVVAYLLLWPVPLDPVAWTPPPAPRLEGPFAPNDRLAAVERVPAGGAGPEDVAIDGEGRIVAGLADGRIVRMGREGAAFEVLANTGGRPLGLHHDAAGNLIVADAMKGLLSVSPTGELRVLATEHGGRPFKLTDDVDIAADGTIYFSDASWRWSVREVREDVLEHRPYGRLLAYEPASGEVRLLADGLYFANGVAVAADESFVLVTETTSYRVMRHWLVGERAGQTEVLVDNLPGLPDGISRGSDGRFWIALYSPRIPDLDAMMPRPWLRKVVYRLPGFLQPQPIRHAFVLSIDERGQILDNLQHRGGASYSPITSVQEHDGWLYLGSLERPQVARLALPPRP